MIAQFVDRSFEAASSAFQNLQSYVEDTVQNTPENTKQKIKAIGAGMGVGTCLFAVTTVFSKAIQLILGSQQSNNAAKLMLKNHPFQMIVIGPIVAGVICQGFIQESFLALGKKYLPDTEIEIFSHKIKLAALVSIVATSVFLGVLALGSGALVAGGSVGMHLILGTLTHVYKEDGLSSSITAQITNNALAYGLLL